MSYRINGVVVPRETFESRKLAGESGNFEEPDVDIAYHWVVERVGKEIQIISGRSIDMDSAAHKISGHKTTFNKDFLGICLVGNFGRWANDWQSTTPDSEMLFSLNRLVKNLMIVHRFGPEKVYGHCELFDLAGTQRQKTCPGLNFDIQGFRDGLA